MRRRYTPAQGIQLLSLILALAMISVLITQNTAGYTVTGYKVQQGRSLLSSASQDVSISPVSNMSRAFVLPPFYYSTGQKDVTPTSGTTAQTYHNWADYTIQLSDESTVTLTREATDANVWATWQVLEAMGNEFKVYRGDYDATNAGADFFIPIGATVDESSTMVLVTGHRSNDTANDYYDRFLMRAYAYNSSHIRVRRGDGTATDVHISWSAVEWNLSRIATFQTGTVLVDGGVNTESNPAVVTLGQDINTSCSILVFQIDVPDSGVDQVSVAGYIHNSTEIDFYPSSVGTSPDTTVDRNVRWYVVDFGDRCGYQARGQVDYSSDANWYNHTETLGQSVALNKSIIFVSLTQDGTGDAQSRPFPNAWLPDENTLEVFRTYYGQESYIEWQVVELPYAKYILSWNQSSLDLGSAVISGGNLTGSANITTVTNQTNASVGCQAGNCSIITVSWNNGTSMSDGETRQANFTCDNSTMGVFWAEFLAVSDEDRSEEAINITCEMTGSTYVAFNQSSLFLGIGNQSLGSITGHANITSAGINDNVSVQCSQGDCDIISQDWINGTDMADGESIQVMFECDDSRWGSFSAAFEVKSNEDTEPNEITVDCEMLNPPPPQITGLANQSSGYDWILWNWSNPDAYDFDHVELWVNSNFYGNVSLNYSNVTGLLPDTNYELEARTVDTEGNINTTWVNSTAKTLYDYPVNITLNSPRNNSFDYPLYRVLNITVSDVESGVLCVDIFGADQSPPEQDQLLYRNCSVLNNSDIVYNWTAPIMETGSDVEVLWHFDNRSEYLENGSFVFNFAGSAENHDRTCTANCPQFVNDCKFAGCFEYDGLSEYWLLNESYFNAVFTEKSFQAWIKPAGLSGSHTIYDEGGTTNGFALRLVGNLLEFATQDNQVITTVSYTYDDITHWHFITAQFNSSNMTLYFDGVLVNTTNTSYSSISGHSDEGGLGYTYNGDAFDNTNPDYYAGRIDEVRILNTALDSTEVESSYSLKYGMTYHWQAEAMDDYETWQSGEWQFTIRDIVPPSWDPLPGDIYLETGDSLYYDANATDNWQVDSYSINDTVTFMINSSTGVLENKTGLDIGIYRLNISVNDTASNINWTVISITVNDTIFPEVREISPADGTGYYLFDAVNITANVTDNYAVGNVFANISWPGGGALQQMTDADGDSVYDTLFLNTITLGRYNVTIIANDSFDNVNDTETTWFNVSANSSVRVFALEPLNKSGDSDGNVVFMFNVSSNYEISSCTLMLNSSAVATNNDINTSRENNITRSGLAVGEYTWHINCTDDYGAWNRSSEMTLTVVRATQFEGKTTDFGQVDMENISNLVLENPAAGLINFSGNINLSGGYDIDEYVRILSNNISVDTVQLPVLNRSAVIIFYNLGYGFAPLPVADGQLCPGSQCTFISYDSVTGTYIINVSHFTAYSTTSNSMLTIYDDADLGQSPVTYKAVSFYANYTNKSDGSPVQGAGAWCRVSFSDNSNVHNMTYSSGLYVYNRSFYNDEAYSYNVTCNGDSLGYEPASAEDNIKIGRPAGYLEDGNCTIEYIDKGQDFRQGFLQQGEQARIYCESPIDIDGGEDISIIVVPQNGIETRKDITVPDVLSGKYEVLYP